MNTVKLICWISLISLKKKKIKLVSHRHAKINPSPLGAEPSVKNIVNDVNYWQMREQPLRLLHLFSLIAILMVVLCIVIKFKFYNNIHLKLGENFNTTIIYTSPKAS